MNLNTTTVYELIDEYSKPLQGLIGVTERFAASVLRATSILEGAAAAAFYKFTKDAVEEATKIDRLTNTFGALAGSMDVAGQKMQWLEGFSQTARAHFDDLAESGTLLEAAGLRMERFIPIINEVTGVFGASRQNVIQFSEAIERLASGSLGSAERSFRRFGITLGDFQNAGITVDKGGRTDASATELLEALESVVHTKFGGITEFIKNDMSLAFSNVSDAWNKMLDGFGKGWFPFIKRVLNEITPFLQFLASSGEMEQLGESFATAIKDITGIDGKDGGLPRFLSYIVAVMEELPDLIDDVAIVVTGTFKTFMESFSTIADGITSTIENILNGAMHLTKNLFSYTTNMINAFIDRLSVIPGFDIKRPEMPYFPPDLAIPKFGSASKFFDDVFSGLRYGFGSDVDKIKNRSDEIYNDFLHRDQSKRDDGVFPMFNDAFKPLQDTADNTAEIARNTASFSDMLKRYVVGGGPLAQIGVTPTELGRSGTRQPIVIQVGHKAVNEWVTELVEKVVQEGTRQNLWGGIQ